MNIWFQVSIVAGLVGMAATLIDIGILVRQIRDELRMR